MAEIAGILAHPMVAVALIAIGLTGIAVELMSPGFGAPGAVGLGAFVLFFWAQFVANGSGWGAPLLFAVGLALLILEVFLPTFGVLGVLGFLALMAGIVSAASTVWVGLAALGGGLLITGAVLWALVKLFGFKPSWNKLVLANQMTSEQGYVASRDRSGLLGKTGVALTMLRPSGFAELDGQREDVVSEGEIIPAGSKVQVIHVEGSRVVVRKITQE
jgi:membrane-bound ClpP family serine protease